MNRFIRDLSLVGVSLIGLCSVDLSPVDLSLGGLALSSLLERNAPPRTRKRWRGSQRGWLACWATRYLWQDNEKGVNIEDWNDGSAFLLFSRQEKSALLILINS
ncbi:hypothetical protein F4801DRAFT_559444 [Xylaria longipes]|nr:hypothetical protein F4801DRAFT_559444 [Xylaria longipes]